jgi:hypothetical protein
VRTFALLDLSRVVRHVHFVAVQPLSFTEGMSLTVDHTKSSSTTKVHQSPCIGRRSPENIGRLDVTMAEAMRMHFLKLLCQM